MEEAFIFGNNTSQTHNRNINNLDFFGLSKLDLKNHKIQNKEQPSRSKAPFIPESIVIDDDDSPVIPIDSHNGMKPFEEKSIQNPTNYNTYVSAKGSWLTQTETMKEYIEVLDDENNDKSLETEHTVLLGDDSMVIEEDENKENKEDIQEVMMKQGSEEAVEFLEPVNPEKPLLWINKLKYYASYAPFENTVSFRELLYEDLLKGDPDIPKRTLESAFLTTYGFDLELLEPILRAGVKVTLVDECGENDDPPIQKNMYGYANLTLVKPYRSQIASRMGVFHAKLWLLKFPRFLRVVVGSGNLCVPQWVMWSNCLWFQDFPLKVLAKSHKDMDKRYKNLRFNKDEDFVETLENFIIKTLPKWVNYPDLLGFSLDEYLFSNIDIVLIPSIPGKHYDTTFHKNFDKYGHRKVAAVLKKTSRSSKNYGKRVLTYQSTSLSGLDEKFLSELLSSFVPDFCTVEDLLAIKEGRMKNNLDSISSRVRLIYPSKEYVENSKDGPINARPLKLTPEGYEKKGFPKDIFHHFESPHQGDFHTGIIPHLKMGVVTDESGEIDDDTVIYYGSHNLSAAAWGRYERNYTQISIGNAELGVLFPPGRGTKAQKEKILGNISFKFPPKKYDDNQVPWITKLHLKNDN